MSQKVWRRRNLTPESSVDLAQPRPISNPPTDLAMLQLEGESFTFDTFTADDAWALGTLLRARLRPLAAAGSPTLISIASANSSQVLFQCVTGPGVMPDNEIWVARKRNTVMRFGRSTWIMHCKYDGDEELFRAKFGMSQEEASQYAIHGGAMPIRVRGVEGIVAVVVVSGLKQHEDHGVIVDVIKENWEIV